jgi:hypothetical protein
MTGSAVYNIDNFTFTFFQIRHLDGRHVGIRHVVGRFNDAVPEKIIAVLVF